MTSPTTPAPAPRRGLGRALTTLLVVDALLVVAVLVALAAYLSAGDDLDAGAGGTPPASVIPGEETPAPGRSPTAGGDGDGPATFALPSGNIACEITDAAATCTVAESDAEATPAEGCAGTIGPVVSVAPEGASAPCVSGALPGPAAPGTPVLEYGSSSTVGDYTCTSSTSGVTCTHEPSGAGFRLARAGYELF